MELVYTNVEQTSIQATLVEGENLGNVSGPAVIFVPVDPANNEYQAILESGQPIDAYVPPEAKEPEPVSLPPVMPTDPSHAAPKGYVDTEVAAVKSEINPMVERIEALEARMLAVERRK